MNYHNSSEIKLFKIQLIVAFNCVSNRKKYETNLDNFNWMLFLGVDFNQLSYAVTLHGKPEVKQCLELSTNQYRGQHLVLKNNR